MELNTVLSRNFTEISEEYRKFATEKDACRHCDVFNCYKQIAQSEGNAKSPTFVFIGEGYGKDEVQQMRPFIGRAGQRLRAELRKHPNIFNRNTCLLTNVLSCRPPNNKFPRDRKIVTECAERWVQREIGILKPKVIVTLGGQSLDYIRGERGVTARRGTWVFLEAFKAWSFATYHPSYVIRCENAGDKEFVVQQFEAGIQKIAQNWEEIMENDPRMQMSEDEWRMSKALTQQVNARFIREEPISR